MKYITDMGEDIVLTDDDGNKTSIGRYGVWASQYQRKFEVIDTGTDLAELQKKHGPGLRVHVLGRDGAWK